MPEPSGKTASGDRLITHLSTDSRTLQPGDLFVALRGDNFDGHRFVDQAEQRGAAGAVVEEAVERPTTARISPLLRVADTLVAYQQIAAHYRRSLGIKVVAITGSNGKTSTKDFTASVLARRFRVTKTEGNFNNHVGLPAAPCWRRAAQDQIGVWEIGMNHPGEIAPLAQLARPDVAIITNIGIAHIEFIGSREAIAQEKGDLAAAFGPDGTVILNAATSLPKSSRSAPPARVILRRHRSGRSAGA